MGALGEDLLDLCKLAREEVVLAAPFVKVGVLNRLLEHVASEVEVTCVTRWRPEEVAAGVSDLEVLDVLCERAGGRVLLRSDLHAKYYRADGSILIGSANLTATALGWRQPANFELLVPWEVGKRKWSATEAELFEGTVAATPTLRDLVAAAAAEIKVGSTPMLVDAADEEQEEEGSATAVSRDRAFWIPRLRHPDSLFTIYRVQLATVTKQGRVDGARDLAVLKPVKGLEKAAFQKTIGAMLLQFPTISAIDQLVVEAKRFGEVRAFLRDRLRGVDELIDAGEAWQTIIRWLIYFLPERYEISVPGEYSEVFRRV